MIRWKAFDRVRVALPGVRATAFPYVIVVERGGDGVGN